MSEGAELRAIQEAASELGVTRVTLYRWIKAGRLTAYTRPAGMRRTFVDMRQARKLFEPKPVKRRQK